MKIKVAVLFLFFATFGIAQEEVALLSPPMIPQENTALSLNPNAEEDLSVRFKNAFLYGSFSPAPGGGVSIRTRNNYRGRAFDFKVGFFYKTPVVSADYNFFYFHKMSETALYLSWGFGLAQLIPCAPLRAGIQFKYGFIDIGGKLLLLTFPLPEARAGFGLKF